MINRVLSISKRHNFMLRIPHSNIRPTFQIAAFCILLGTFTIVEAQKPKSALTMKVEDVKALIPAIEAVERSLSNIKIKSEAWVETKASLSDPCEPWKRTPIYVSSTAWFDGRPRGKARVDVHKKVLEWIDGAAPYSETSYSEGFDGEYGRFIMHSSGYNGQIFPAKRGRILPNSPESLKSGWTKRFTGIHFTLNFFFSGTKYTFSDIFERASEPNSVEASTFEFTLEQFEGIESIKMASKGTKSFQKNWWIDPQRGFALLGHKYTVIAEDGSERLIRLLKANKLRKVAHGIWWPMEASVITSPTGPDKPWERFVYRASNVVVNDPNFDESVFTVPFPEGYLIYDQVTGRKYKVGGK